MTDLAAELRQRNKAVWSAGEWDAVSRLVAEVGPKLLDRVGIEEGMEVLDVGTGSRRHGRHPRGRARRHAWSAPTSCPTISRSAGSRAEDAGVEVEWVEADAEALPFPDGGFDRVLDLRSHVRPPPQPLGRRAGRAYANRAA